MVGDDCARWVGRPAGGPEAAALDRSTCPGCHPQKSICWRGRGHLALLTRGTDGSALGSEPDVLLIHTTGLTLDQVPATWL